jgi:hypothetical protein
MGAKGAIVVPCHLHAERQGHAPVVAVLLASAGKGRRAHLCPQRAWTPNLPVFGLTMRLAATRRGRRGHNERPLPNLSAKAIHPQADAVMVGEGHAPLWQYFCPGWEKRCPTWPTAAVPLPFLRSNRRRRSDERKSLIRGTRLRRCGSRESSSDVAAPVLRLSRPPWPRSVQVRHDGPISQGRSRSWRWRRRSEQDS